MNQEFIDDLIISLKKIKKQLKKNQIIDSENTVLLKDIMSDIVILSGNITQFINQIKQDKNSKQIQELIDEQIIHEKIIKKFLPAMMAYSILLRKS